MLETLDALIEAFIKEVQSHYPALTVTIERDFYDGSYLIYHNYADEDQSDDFIDFTLALTDQYFYDKDFYNVGFSYHYASKENYHPNLESALSQRWHLELDDVCGVQSEDAAISDDTVDYQNNDRTVHSPKISIPLDDIKFEEDEKLLFAA